MNLEIGGVMALKASLAGIALLLLVSATAYAMPPDGMIPPGATKLRDGNGVTEFDILMQPADIVAYYRKTLPAMGYSLTDDVDTPTSISFFFSRGADETGSVLIRQGIDAMHVTLTLKS